MIARRLGRSGIQVSAVGMGCWAIGGPFERTDGESRSPMGWGRVDDAESIRAIHRALDLGVNFFDTADNYGAGHSERVLGRALSGRRAQAVIATKFGSVFDEDTRTHFDNADDALTPAFVRQACEASLRRLGVETIDLYQLHRGGYALERVDDLLEVLEGLVAEGKIRWYGWSTDDPGQARRFARGERCTAVQHRLNVFHDAPEMLSVCREHDLASINKSPLSAGLLTGKFTLASDITDEQDERYAWDFSTGVVAQRVQQVEALRAALTQDGRTLAQGALGWNLASSPLTIPIPGFKTVRQVEENAGTLDRGPLGPEQMAAVDRILER